MPLIPKPSKDYWIVVEGCKSPLLARFEGRVRGTDVYRVNGKNDFLAAQYVSSSWDDALEFIADSILGLKG